MPEPFEPRIDIHSPARISISRSRKTADCELGYRNSAPFSERLVPEIIKLVYQLDNRHRGGVADTGAKLDDPCIAAVARRVFGTKLIEQLVNSLFMGHA